MRERHVREEPLLRFHLPRHEIDRAFRQLLVDLAARVEIVEMRVRRRLAFDAFHHVRQRDDFGVEARRAREHAFVRGARNPVPLVEAAVFRITAFAVAEMPFAETRGRIALRRDQLAERDLPRDDALRQSCRHRLQSAGADGVTAGHERRARGHAIGLDVEVQKAQTFVRERIDA